LSCLPASLGMLPGPAAGPVRRTVVAGRFHSQRNLRAMNLFSVRNYLLAVIASFVFFGLPTRAAPDRAHVVNVYAWSDYFPQSVVEKFQSETGVHDKNKGFGFARNAGNA